MKNFVTFLLIFASITINVNAQLRYPIVGYYKNCTAQGMAIHGHYAYLFNDGGRCRVFDLQKAMMKSEFLLSSHASTNHVNNACFGIECGSYNDIPLLYITECNNKFRCFVEEILPGSSRLVQTISAEKNGNVVGVLVWVVDKERGLLYSVTRSDETLKGRGYSLNTITAYELPKISDNINVVLTEKDVVERYVVHFPSILQGAIIDNGILYIATGLQQSVSGRLDAKRAIQVIDLKKRKHIKTIDLTYITTNEPEDIDFYQGKCLLYCGQEGGIYEVQLK